MSAIIYEIINRYNYERGIMPYKYIGSDQHNKKDYYGSSKILLEDIKRIGKEYFEKKILYEFSDEISNIFLRKIESQIQTIMDVAKNPEYYNRTNSSHKGYIETEEEKKQRLHKRSVAYRNWWDNLSEEQKIEHIKKSSHTGADNGFKGKTYEEIYGKEGAEIKKKKHRGKNNAMSKRILDINTGKIFDTMIEAMNYYGIKKYGTLRNKCILEKEFKFI